MKFSFLHIADIHLGRPFSDISQSDDKTDLCEHACFKSFDKIIDLALSKKVDFILIAGDSFDSDNSDLTSKLCFIKNLKKLANNGIKSYVICGNHDPVTFWEKDRFWAELKTDENIHITGVTTDDYIETFAPLEGVNITSVSFPTDEMLLDLKKLETKNQKDFNICLLHCDLDKTDTKYAPVLRDDLKKLGYDYYALGHIHIPETKEPNIVYAGSPQGRTRKETGEHGCFLVEVENNNLKTEFISTDCVRFDEVEIDCSDCETKIEVYNKILNTLCDKPEETELGLYEVNLTGVTKGYKELSETDNILKEYNDNFSNIPDIEVYRINNCTTPLIDEDELLKDKGIVGLLMNIDDETIEKAYETIAERHRNIYKTLKTDKTSKEFLTESLVKNKDSVLDRVKTELKSICSEIYEG